MEHGDFGQAKAEISDFLATVIGSGGAFSYLSSGSQHFVFYSDDVKNI